LEIVYLRETK